MHFFAFDAGRGRTLPRSRQDGAPAEGCQTDLFTDRRSTARNAGHSVAAVVRFDGVCAHAYGRWIGLAHFALAMCGTIRLELLKLGVLVKISARRVSIAFAPASSPKEWRFAADGPLSRGGSQPDVCQAPGETQRCET